ncbi:arsenic transporter [Persephonella sp. KM09-Lau-8]|uniref:arsenic transporter n=1 Tax=Persephonella sp. KM09-Lau-8 TaxID=1158345 RepID=UPI00049558E8|nr:arsenic transporter [Persephonella sp. KM09-Lau-8]
MHIALAVLIFLLSLIFILWQPKGLSIGWTATIGAILALLTGIVSVQDVWSITKIVWDATVAFVGIIFISLILDKIGFFEWAALHIIKKANGNGRKLFIYIILLGALIAAFFANDGAALILTPIVYSNIRYLKLEDRYILPFIIAGGFIADNTSLPLITSNLVNIITADFFYIGFIEYAFKMVVPNIFALLTTLVVLYLYFKKDIVQKYDLSLLKNPDEAIKDWFIFKITWLIGGFLIIGFVVSEIYHIPVSIIITIGAFVFGIATYRKKIVNMKTLVFKETPWQIIAFSIGMYVMIYGLRNVGLTLELAKFIENLHSLGNLYGIVGTGFISAGLSAFMNNLPSVMIVNLAIYDTGFKENTQHVLAYANIVGCDIGSKLTPIGSLSTLIWLHVLKQKGINISWRYYFKIGMIITPIFLIFTLLGLYLWNYLT